MNAMQTKAAVTEQCSLKIPPGEALRYILTC
jgi:hypothetical protein